MVTQFLAWSWAQQIRWSPSSFYIGPPPAGNLDKNLAESVRLFTKRLCCLGTRASLACAILGTSLFLKEYNKLAFRIYFVTLIRRLRCHAVASRQYSMLAGLCAPEAYRKQFSHNLQFVTDELLKLVPGKDIDKHNATAYLLQKAHDNA